MSLNPTGMNGSSWNMSNPDREGYSLELYGTVVALQEVQARMYNPGSNQPGAPRFWPDGNPVMNIRMALADPSGNLKTVTFGKAGRKQVSGEKPSLHMQLFGLTNGNMMELIGKTIHLWTWPANPNTGQVWGQGNPRLFGVEEITDGTVYQLMGQLPPEYSVPQLLANDGANGGQMNSQPMPANPQMMQQPQVPPMMQGGFYAPPVQQQYPYSMQQPAQYQPHPQPMAQPQPQVAQQPVPAIQAMPPQAMTAPMPQGMDPVVAQAMQAVGATGVQFVSDNGGSVYDESIPV